MKKEIKEVIQFTQANVPFFEGKTIGLWIDKSTEQIWFHGPDVARLLAYDSPHHMYRMVDDENKTPHNVAGLKSPAISISEAGFYQVALLSRTENGKKLMNWVCSVLLPSIRKTGAYLSDTMTPEQVSRVVEDQIVEKCIGAARGKRVVIGNLVKALLEKHEIGTIRKDIFPYILRKMSESQVYRVKEIFFDRATEAISDWGNQRFIASGGKLDVCDHINLLYLLKETEEKKSTFLTASRSQTVRQLKAKSTKLKICNKDGSPYIPSNDINNDLDGVF